MNRRILALVGILAACSDPKIQDTGGRSLDMPVPSSGTLATTRGTGKDILEFPKRAKQDPRKLDTRTGPLGVYLVDATGRALYAFSDDQNGETACLTNCATVWPPVIVKELPAVLSAAIDAAKLGITTRPDGKGQLVYAKLPLYYSESDRKPEETWGHYAMSFGGRFALVGPDGKPLPPPR